MPHDVFSQTAAPKPPKRHGGWLEALGGLLVILAAIAVYAWFFPDQAARIRDSVETLYARSFPCSRPETFSLGAFDDRFGISRSEFLGAIQKAQGVWEDAAGRPLFRLVDTGGALTVNLVYDERQKATDTLRKLGVSIDADKAGYDRLKAEHDALEKDYAPKKAAFDAAVAAHERRVAAYEAEVASWNTRGGAPKPVYEQLNAEREAISAEAKTFNQQRDTLNATVDRINANVTVLNRLANALNITADTYNGISSSRGKEFEEGLFTGTQAGGKIDIFEFDDRDRLVRLLVHETGHALGLEHVDDPEGVMYRLNKGKSISLTDADKAELRRACKL